MTDAAALVKELRPGRAWAEIAALCKKHGADHGADYWRQIARGDIKRPHWRSINALRRAQEPPLPDLAPGIEYAAECGVTVAIQVDDHPDAALLVDLRGRAPHDVSVHTDGVPLAEATGRPASNISALTSRRTQDTRKSVHPYTEDWEAGNLERLRLGLTWPAMVHLWREKYEKEEASE